MTMITQVSAYQPLLQQLSRQIEINIQLRRDLAAAEVQFNAAQAGLAKSKTKAAYTDTLLTELSQLQTAYARSSEAFRALTLQHETLTRDNAQLQLESKKNQDRLKRSKEEIQSLQQQLFVLKESNARALHACQQINERQTTELAILTKELLAAEKRLQHSSITGTPERPANGRNNLKADLQLLKKTPLFDANWYLQTYPDVAKAGMNPAEHYLRHGGFENRNPSAQFDSGAYLQRYPDVRQSGANPLIHFLLDGERQGCEAEPVKESDGG